MKRCILHIGMHKTGSTSIQESLDGYADTRFLYAKIGDVSNHSLAMYSLFAADPERHHLHRAGGRTGETVRAYNDSVRADLEHSIDMAGDRTLLISGEDISALPRTGIASLHEYFKRRFDELRIVGYVRPPAGYITSSFQQQVKGGSIEKVDLDRQYRNYRNAFAKFDDFFGRENVHLWKFDPRSFPSGCAVQDFCSRLAIPLPRERIVRRNESLSREAVGLLYTYGKLARMHGAAALRPSEGHRVGELIARHIGNHKFRISPDVTRPILAKNKLDIEWMEARLGLPLTEELGEHQQGDVRGEANLLVHEPKLLSTLLAFLGSAVPASLKDKTPTEIAVLVRTLPTEGAPAAPAARPMERPAAKQAEIEMNLADLVENVRRNHPKLLEGIAPERAEQFVNGVFQQVNDALAATEDGIVKYPGLGQFWVRKVEREVNGEKVTRTQVVFRRAEPGTGRNKE